MPRFDTRYFGSIEWPEDALLIFPQGLPGFEQERAFAPLASGPYGPLIFLQSVLTPELCFLALPVAAVDPDYELDIQAEELRLIEAGAAAGLEVIVLLTACDGSPATANLLAPVIIDPKSRRAVQAIRRDSRYSCRHPLEGAPLGERLAPCL